MLNYGRDIRILQIERYFMNFKMFTVSVIMLLATVVCSAKEILHLKSQAEIDNAIKSNKMVIIDYHAEKHCGPCQQMAKILPDIAKEYTEVQLVKVDVDDFDVAEIRSVPTFVFYMDGKEVKRFAGSKSKASFINVMNETFKCCNTNKK